ncbi:hypothetical protein [Paraburkholderia strydomiana]|uniref:hypothetical protein n=1 Tax=Paraburkholderia strydomiana TaxID=1245417 RepID=UPI00285E694E|nr:hypothetical protein [Paraburkholderia strydomiana]MDR7005857.1 hypothetical protein [Paraburkholderia strydomiana]
MKMEKALEKQKSGRPRAEPLLLTRAAGNGNTASEKPFDQRTCQCVVRDDDAGASKVSSLGNGSSAVAVHGADGFDMTHVFPGTRPSKPSSNALSTMSAAGFANFVCWVGYCVFRKSVRFANQIRTMRAGRL